MPLLYIDACSSVEDNLRGRLHRLVRVAREVAVHLMLLLLDSGAELEQVVRHLSKLGARMSQIGSGEGGVVSGEGLTGRSACAGCSPQLAKRGAPCAVSRRGSSESRTEAVEEEACPSSSASQSRGGERRTGCFASRSTFWRAPACALSKAVKRVWLTPVLPPRPVRPIRWM